MAVSRQTALWRYFITSCSLHPSLHLIVISVCASHQASPLRTSSGPLLGDGPLINEGARMGGGGGGAWRVRVCAHACVFVSFSAVITN